MIWNKNLENIKDEWQEIKVYSYTTIVPCIVRLILLFLPPQKKVLKKEDK